MRMFMCVLGRQGGRMTFFLILDIKYPVSRECYYQDEAHVIRSQSEVSCNVHDIHHFTLEEDSEGGGERERQKREVE